MQTSWRGLLKEAATEFSPPHPADTVQWMSDHYALPSVTGFSGSYNYEHAPYFIGVALAADDPEIYEVDLMKASQIGWTYWVIGYVLERIDQEPCPILGVFAKEKDAKAFHDEKLVPTVLANPNCPMDVSTSRKSGNRWDFKEFPAGYLKLVGSNSPGNVKSTSSVGLALIEEPDDTSDNVAEQGDAIGLTEERLKRYTGNKLLIVGGTPAVKGVSKTEARLAQSDKRVLPIACHECGGRHVLDWSNVDWYGKNGEIPCDESTGEILSESHEVFGYSQPETAVYICPDCGCEWDDYQRQKNVRDTVYNALEEGDPYAGWTPTQPTKGVAGFMGISELYVCIPGTSLAQVVQEYLKAKHEQDQGKVEAMIKFINQKLGLPYEYETDAPDEDELAAKALDYSEMTIPAGGWVLTAGVDVQHDRLAVVIRAWGRGEESWLVYWGEMAAKKSTSDPTDPVWQELHTLLTTPIQHERGFGLRISAMSIDSSDGSTSDQVYSWVRARVRYNVMAIKGASNDYGTREIYTKPKDIDLTVPKAKQTKAARFGVKVYIVGTHKSKDLIIGERGRVTLEGSGPGRFHYYEGVRADYYEQLMSHILAPDKRLRGKKTWQKKASIRDEGLDCEIYALHAARSLGLNRWSVPAWDKLEQQLMQADMFAAPAQESEPVSKPASQQRTQPARSGRVLNRGVEL